MQHLQPQAGSPFENDQLDPMLLVYDGGHQQEMEQAPMHHDFRNGHANGMLDNKVDNHDIDSLLELSPSQVEYRDPSWQPDPTMASLEQESEFDKWM